MNFEQFDFLQNCPCGKDHSLQSEIVIESGAIGRLPAILCARNIARVHLIADGNTYAAAGKTVAAALLAAGIRLTEYVFENGIEPDENASELAEQNYTEADAIVAVGSGVINDIGKILANDHNKTYVIVGTAPSMDGCVSATSSVVRGGLKISLPSKCADIIIGDLDVLAAAPMKMMVAGLGDMLAKYISIAEWRIAHIVCGEYYCENVAKLVRTALKKCVDNADGLLQRDKQAVRAVFEGLVICGAAMKFAGLSRPASGQEHYFSHIWDMRGVEFGTPIELHGIQCAVGTLLTAKLYEKLLAKAPDRQTALAYAAEFDFDSHAARLRRLLGKGAESMIAAEAKDKKYDVSLHAERLEIILAHWNDICAIVQEEVPSVDVLNALLQKIGCPTTPEQIGQQSEMLPDVFAATKDIRDKYVLSRLAWDLGEIDNLL